MLKEYIHLSHKDQQEILRDYASESKKDPLIVEKDIWVCWVLKQLFEMPDRLNMAFKGGTSLSKVYSIIDRFSEDIDITLDYRQFNAFSDLNMDLNQLGRNARKRLDVALKLEVKTYTENIVAPYLREMVSGLRRSKNHEVKVSENGESLYFTYPSAVGGRGDYMLDHVLIEFGGRNIIDPNENWIVKPYIADVADVFEYPSSNITVLSPERTFWEKATLIHVECHRGVRESAERLSRHWFDLMAFGNHPTGLNAIQNITLLKDVVALKSVFFNAGYANYDQCLAGNFLLIPDQEGLTHLEHDFNKMNDAKMFYGSSVSFTEMMAAVKDIEGKVNESIRKCSSFVES